MKPRRAKTQKTPETPVAERIRAYAATYAAAGMHERAQGLLQAADLVDQDAARGGGGAKLERGDELDRLRQRVAWLEQAVFPHPVGAVKEDSVPWTCPDCGLLIRDTVGSAAPKRKRCHNREYLTADVVGGRRDPSDAILALHEDRNGLLGKVEIPAPERTPTGVLGYKTLPTADGALGPPRIARATVVVEPGAAHVVDVEIDKMAKSFAIVLADERQPLSRVALAVRAGYVHGSGPAGEAIAKLRRAGFVEGRAGALSPTPALLEWRKKNAVRDGRMKIPEPGTLVTYWVGRLSDMAGAILEVLTAVYPNVLERGEVGQRAGYVPTSGAFGEALSEIVRFGLVWRPRPKHYAATGALMTAADAGRSDVDLEKE